MSATGPVRHSAVYEGWVQHRRHRPVENAFRYRLYMLYLDLEELPRLFRRRALWSLGRPNLAWFRRADYLGDAKTPLDTAVRDLVEARTGRRPAGPIRMLTQVRTFGYVFNPVTFYYCFDEAGARVESIVTDITNTPWGERHAYVHGAPQGEGASARHRYRFRKTFHVSPFMRMAQDYDWRFAGPGERLGVHMASTEDGAPMLDATLALKRRPWSARSLARVLVLHPLITFKVPIAIYLQAFRLWWKRCPFVPHPRRSRGSDDVPNHHVPDRGPAAEPGRPAPRPAHRDQPPARADRRAPQHS